MEHVRVLAGRSVECALELAGVEHALLLDSSADALALARRNLALNGVEARAELQSGNAFDGLRDLDARGERFGLVVLDPPPFTRRKDAVEAAARGYKEINIRGLRLLERGGRLATFSCSHHVWGDPVAFTHRRRIAELAMKHRLPTMHFFREAVEVGGLLGFGPNLPQMWRKAGRYVDKILKGAKPADVPVEQPTNYELVINLKTAARPDDPPVAPAARGSGDRVSPARKLYRL